MNHPTNAHGQLEPEEIVRIGAQSYWLRREPDPDTPWGPKEKRMFQNQVQRAVLLALLEQKRLTQSQVTACFQKLQGGMEEEVE